MLLFLGGLTLVVAWGAMLAAGEHLSFSAHMMAHMSIVAVAAPLIAFGLAGGSLNPVPRAPRRYSPLIASLVELAVVWAWHMPLLHQTARQHLPALLAEQASFLASGLYLWISVAGGGEHSRGVGVVGLLLTAMHMTLLGALLALAPRPLYEHAHGSPSDILADQQTGGVIMLLTGGISYLSGGLWLSRRLLRYRER